MTPGVRQSHTGGPRRGALWKLARVGTCGSTHVNMGTIPQKHTSTRVPLHTNTSTYLHEDTLLKTDGGTRRMPTPAAYSSLCSPPPGTESSRVGHGLATVSHEERERRDGASASGQPPTQYAGAFSRADGSRPRTIEDPYAPRSRRAPSSNQGLPVDSASRPQAPSRAARRCTPARSGEPPASRRPHCAVTDLRPVSGFAGTLADGRERARGRSPPAARWPCRRRPPPR